MKKLAAIICALLFMGTVAYGATLPDEPLKAYEQAIKDQDSQLCKLLKKEIKTTDFTLQELLAIPGLTYDGHSEQQLLSANDTKLYYIYAMAKNPEKEKSYNLLTCLYLPEGESEYLTQSGEFDTKILKAMEWAQQNNTTPTLLLVYKDAGFLMCSDGEKQLFYPITTRAESISEKPCDYTTATQGLDDLKQVNTQGFFTSANIKRLGMAIILLGLGLFAYQFYKSRRG